LDSKTRNWRRRALDSICEKHADKPVALMRPKQVRALRDERADTPGAANIRLKALRALFRWAVEADGSSSRPNAGRKQNSLSADRLPLLVYGRGRGLRETSFSRD
jgi:hypothetical protein